MTHWKAYLNKRGVTPVKIWETSEGYYATTVQEPEKQYFTQIIRYNGESENTIRLSKKDTGNFYITGGNFFK